MPHAVRVFGFDNPDVDLMNVRRAIRRATQELGPAIVELAGVFDLGNCSRCLKVPSRFTLRGAPDVAVLKAAGVAPVVVADEQGGNVLLERLWIKGAQTMAVMYSHVTGHVVMSRVKITGVRPGGGFRFGVAGVGKGVSGRVTFEHNTIDHDEPWDGPGDDNGIAFAGANLAFVNITQNFIRAGEAVEIEGCSGLHSSYLVSRNTIVQTSVRSSLAASTVCLAFPHEQGGHPAAIKLVGNEALYNLVDENQVDTAVADASAVCILTGTNLNLASTTRVSKNTCTMNGQFGAFVGGWAGTPLFFPPFWVNDMFFVENVLNGSAKFGVSFMNFTYIVNGVPLESQTSVSRSHGNFIVNNDMSRFETSHADLFFDVSTSNNVAIGEFRGSIINLGEQNEIQN